MSIFNYTDYKQFVLEHVAALPKRGRGQFRKMALHLSVNPVIVSQVFKGSRHLNMEQAFEAGDFFGFAANERDYFILLVQYARAGTHSLQKHLLEKIKEAQLNAQDLKKRLLVDKELTEEAKALFYSNWYYSGIRLLSSLKEYNTAEDFSRYFNLPLTRTREVLDFLISHKLCEEKNGQIKVGARRTHVGADSPLVTRHHQNWRLKAIEEMQDLSPEELFFTGPMTLSEETLFEVRKELVNAIDRVMKKIEKSKGEKVACLNIDWFRL